MELTQRIRELTALPGVSGQEDAVREYLLRALQGREDCHCKVDALGNLIVKKNGRQTPAKSLLITAHMDEVGYLITYIEDSGLLRFAPVGGVSPEVMAGKRVYVGQKLLPGLVGLKAVHQQKAAERTAPPEADNLYIDIGAKNAEEARKLVQIGDFAVFEAPRFEQNGVLCGPYLDNRIGCVTLLLMMEQLAETETENDLYFVFTAQEEVGLRGAGAAAFAVEPDVAIAVDVTDTGDLPEMKTAMAVEMGGGPAVKVMDRSVICSPAVCAGLEKAAELLGISTQREILQCGGTDTAALQKARAGVAAGAVSIPTRYIHSPSEMCAVSDVEQSAALLAKFAVL